jgi:hypothetical protein
MTRNVGLPHRIGVFGPARLGDNMRGRALLLAATTFVALVAVTLGGSGSEEEARAATPPEGTVVAKDRGGDSLSYRGSVPPGAGSPAECEEGVNADVFRLNVRGTGGDFYEDHTSLLVIRIDWDPESTDATQDLALHVRHDGEEVASSDGGESRETVALQNPEPGRYRVITCDFLTTFPQDYLGKIFFTTTPAQAERLPRPADARGLKFMPIVTVDPQRDVAEPSLRIDKAGNIYTCGPFGASRAADYAQKSEDYGDTFRALGEPPEGRIAPGGGGDCEISVAPKKNAQGNYTLSYTGLEALLNFSTGRSMDNGRVFESHVFSSSFPLVDRQWLESHGMEEVYLFYNQIPFGGTAQRSTDGGFTYAPPSSQGNAAPSIFRPGPIVIDHNVDRNPDDLANETLYIVFTDDNKVRVARSTDQAETFERFRVATAAGNPANLFPSLSIDTAGNLYAAWIEKGSFNAYYSYSTDQGETWSRKQVVNRRPMNTTTMPWIEAGSPGRIAVSFYCSPSDGNPEIGAGEDRFIGPWHVCVNQSRNALSGSADFSQVRATHHPIHWDSICLSGLACNVIGGDRTLLDFFTLRKDPRTGRLFIAFNESNKKPAHMYAGKRRQRDEFGEIAIITLAKQKSGPSLYARNGQVAPDRRDIIRRGAVDPRGDARFDFSSLGPPDPRRDNINAMDLRWIRLSRSTIRSGGETKPALGIRLKLRDLSDAALADALSEFSQNPPPTQELKVVVRWFSAFRPDWVLANWRPAQGWEFWEGNLKTERCETTVDAKLETYPTRAQNRHEIPGNVDAGRGIITMKMPYSGIHDFDYGRTSTSLPRRSIVRPGDKIFEVTAFTFGHLQDGSGAGEVCASIADYYNQADSTPSFDHRLR